MTSSPCAVVGHAGNRVPDKRFGAGADHDFIRSDVESAQSAHRLRCGRAQLVDTGRWGIAMFTAAHGPDRGILNMRRRRKIRLTDAKRNDVLPLAHQPIDIGQHDECVLGAE